MRLACSLFGSVLVVFSFVLASKAASFNITTEDSTPWLVYNPPGAWTDSLVEDPTQANWENYSSGSWHLTSTPDATVTITFNGTGVWFFGANKPDYGTYSIVVDGTTVCNGSANAPQDAFQVLLGGAGGLEAGEHVAVLANDGTGPIDLDSVMFETWTTLRSRGGVQNAAIDLTSPELEQNPPSSWQTDSSTAAGSQYTDALGAQMQYTFKGDAVAVYGSMSSTYGSYAISIDGDEMRYNASSGMQASFAHPNSLMHFVNGLGPGNHTLTITANPDSDGLVGTGAGTRVAVSNISVYSNQRRNAVTGLGPVTNAVQATGISSSAVPTSLLLAPSTTGTSTSAGGTVDASSDSRALKTKIVIAAIAAGAGIALIAAVFLVLCLLRRRRRTRAASLPEPPPSPKSFVQRPASDASGAFGRPAIPRSVLKPALDVVLEDPFDDRRARVDALDGRASPFDGRASPFGGRADPFADPGPVAETREAVAQRTTPAPVFAAARASSMLAPVEYLGLPSRSPSPSPSSQRTSRWSYSAENPFLVPWDAEGQQRRSIRASPL